MVPIDQMFSLAERLPRGLHTWCAILDSFQVKALWATQSVFNKSGAPPARREWMYAMLIAAFFALIFPILLYKSIAGIEGQLDVYWHQAFLDYDIDWGTSAFALVGNLLFNFGIQVPLNTSLSPILGIARRLSSTYHIAIALTLFSAAFVVLFWNIGRDIGLRPVPRIIFAGLVAVIVNVPKGLDQIIFIVPSFYLTFLLVCGLWWHEMALLSLTAVYLFFCLGQRHSTFQNIALGIVFCLLCWVVLLAFSAGAFFIVPVILLYCIAFLVTARARELRWKAVVGGVLATAMLLTHVPGYFQQLYSYTYGAYFVDVLYTRDIDFMTLFKASMMATTLSYEFRVPVFVVVSLGTLCLCVLRSTGTLKRIAVAVLFTEAGIVLLGCVNALIFRYPIQFFYSEVLHEAFLAGYFVVFLLVGSCLFGFAVDKIFRKVTKYAKRGKLTEWVAANRLKLATLGVLIAALSRAVATPPTVGFHSYPAKQPPSVEILRNELALKPGKPFPGRLLVLGGMLGEPGTVQVPGGPGSAIYVLEGQYKVSLGNDHYVNLLPFGISIANEFAHWTSPVTFVFLRRFFGKTEDNVSKSFFPLRNFNERIARLLGIRMVVSDAPDLPGASVVYHTKAGDADLGIFRVDNVNFGQYSPTHVKKVSTAAEAIAALEKASFDPEHDVLVEEQTTDDFVPARQASVVTDLGPTLSVRAESSGRSLLVLPFEYSRCLRLEAQDGTSAQLIPVNLQQTGLVFEGRVSAGIAYRFGVFDHPQCRRDDLERANRLELRGALK